MRHKGSSTLFDYWNNLRGDRPAPERSEVEPGDIREVLGDTFILEISEQMRTIAFRLAGTRLCAAFGRELKGLGFLALWDENDNFDIAKAVRRVHRDYQPMLVSHVAATATGQFVEFETVMLPLLPVADGNSRILGLSTPRKVPYWLGAEPLIINHLRHMRPIEVPAPSLVPAVPARLPEPPRDTPRRVGHLTVLDGGRGKDL